MRKNNKGFTLVEMLGAVAILGILGTIATAGTIKYLNQSRQKSYQMMSQSIYQAAQNCIIQQKCTVGDTVDTKYLVSNGYLDQLKNPIRSKKDCNGTVKISGSSENQTSGYKKYTYEVTLNCEGLQVEKNKLIWPNARTNNNSSDGNNSNNNNNNNNDVY